MADSPLSDSLGTALSLAALSRRVSGSLALHLELASLLLQQLDDAGCFGIDLLFSLNRAGLRSLLTHTLPLGGEGLTC